MSTTQREVSEVVRRQQQAKVELAKQKRNRVGKQADGGVHAVDRTVSTSRIQDSEDLHELEMPTVKRYVRASSLPGVAPPSGYSVKWVRRDQKVRGDSGNLLRHIQQGWVVARTKMFKQKDLPTTHHTKHGEVIGNDDTILMIHTIEMVADRQLKNKTRQATATRAVHEDSGLQSAVSSAMPLVENTLRSQAGFMRGRRRQAEPAGDSSGAE